MKNKNPGTSIANIVDSVRKGILPITSIKDKAILNIVKRAIE